MHILDGFNASLLEVCMRLTAGKLTFKCVSCYS